ncbi:hypothetical protein [Comamonas thiooxydans]|uniref:hypothetical protein n=1 Tax=Comamonas thiooxydans TaxID=363952 RepID=UPI000B41B1E3|nr:hypothetical protein [Comamonas thiooxydans]
MANHEINAKFLQVIGAADAASILNSIATHYGESVDAIRAEVTGEGAENILDYMTGPERAAAHVLYQMHGFKL